MYVSINCIHVADFKQTIKSVIREQVTKLLWSNVNIYQKTKYFTKQKEACFKNFFFWNGGGIKVYYFFLLQYYDENYARVFHIYCTGTFNLKAHPWQF
jgi:hypothetical protein